VRSTNALSLLAATFVAAIAFALVADEVRAQEPSNLDAQALSIEKQLLCPQCTNERLDVCNIAICVDMRREIREQLIEGRNSDEIIFFFQNRYGQRILADIPKEGFNLVLFGWVAASLLLMSLGGAFFLFRLRAAGRAYRAALATSHAPAPTPDDDDAWLDAELDPESDHGDR
jgi:cytochrome c-type biogenesis protein CcmH/NrfF